MDTKRVRSDEARRTFRALLNEVEHQGAHVVIARYDTPSAVLVPVSWYETVISQLAETPSAARSGAADVQPEGQNER